MQQPNVEAPLSFKVNGLNVPSQALPIYVCLEKDTPLCHIDLVLGKWRFSLLVNQNGAHLLCSLGVKVKAQEGCLNVPMTGVGLGVSYSFVSYTFEVECIFNYTICFNPNSVFP